MNSAYKHLDSRLRVAELTVGQWIGVITAIAVAVVWGVYLSPLGSSLTLVSSIYIVALPVAAALFANLTDFDAWLVARSAFAWRRRTGLFAAGAGSAATGYAIVGDQLEAGQDLAPGTDEIDLTTLWGGS